MSTNIDWQHVPITTCSWGSDSEKSLVLVGEVIQALFDDGPEMCVWCQAAEVVLEVLNLLCQLGYLV